MKTLDVVIVGAGGMGNVHYQNYKFIKGVKVAAVVDKSEAGKKRAAEWNVPCVPSLDALPFRCDVADVCVPTFLHKAVVLQALELGMHVICEKPLALCANDAGEMFAEAEQRKLHLYAAHVLQFTKAVEHLRQINAAQTYGKAISAHFRRLSASPAWSADAWLFDKAKSGLLPYDLHIHDLDVIVSLFGVPEKAHMRAGGRKNVHFPEHADFMYEYPDLIVTAEAAWFNAPFPFTADWLVEFENAVVANDAEKLTIYPAGGNAFTQSTDDEIVVSTGINVPPVGWYYNELSAFVDCIRDDKDCGRVSKQQVLSVLKILDAFEY